MGGASIQQSSLVLRLREGSADRSYWDAQWRYRTDPGEPWRLKKRRLGLAWQEQDCSGRWQKRRGRCPEGWLDERAANVAAVAAMEDHARALHGAEHEGAAVAQRKLTVRSIAEEWLCWLQDARGAKPSTVADYRFCCANLERSTGVAGAQAPVGSWPRSEIGLPAR